MTRLYLTRHGETEWNLEGRIQGSRDSALTEKGIQQARQLGKWLANTHIDRVYSSSSQRAYQTARLIVGNRDLSIVPVDELKEMNLGIWEGCKFAEIQEMYEEQFQTFWSTPHLLSDCPRESFESLKSRVVSAIVKIIEENPGKDILIVAHAIALKSIMSYFENLPLERLFDERILQPTSLSVVEVEQGIFRVIQYGDTEHYRLTVSTTETVDS